MDYKLLCYCLEIIGLCVGDHLLHVQCMQSGLFELTEKFANGSDTAVQLISKAIIGHLITECPSKSDEVVSLSDEEITLFLALFQTGSSDSWYISDCTAVGMLKSFMKNKANVERFEQHKLTHLLEQIWKSSDIDVIVTQLNSSSLETTNTVEGSETPSCDTGILHEYNRICI